MNVHYPVKVIQLENGLEEHKKSKEHKVTILNIACRNKSQDQIPTQRNHLCQSCRHYSRMK